MKNAFFKGHALGNDYIAVDPGELEFRLTPKRVRALCDRHRGVGADGLLALAPSRSADFGLRIYNPDGGEAEKSGNGIRIFARYLHATRRARRPAFRIETRGGVVGVALDLDAHGEAGRASVEMGRASFRPRDLPCTLDVPELVDRPIRVAGRALRFTGLSLGNPHCVLFRPRGRAWSREEVRDLGPRLERHRIFPKRCNVSFAEPVGPRELFLRIWERGAGETEASGTSASAAACAALRLGLVSGPALTVRSSGGTLRVRVAEGFAVTLDGPVEEVARGRLAPAFVRALR